ncbi:MAG TPA: type 1 glutamine amidotransferase [Longimicrobiales bacterium]|nr:type 1 glutamine amidotransferase [Longimicrobiales bacterium]
MPRLEEVAGLAMMGGPMSANDDLPWISALLPFINDCVASDIPVIGHCLGGQLLARALDAPVTRNPVKEIGWGRVEIEDRLAASEWGPIEPFESYHWHGETFAIPARATRIWSSAQCANQAFVLGKHIGMQCHIEITEQMIDDWCESGADEIAHSLSRSPAVQTPDEMREDLTGKLQALRRVADRVYERWVSGLEGA